MRIDNWPLDRIMRLPDWCFGRRFWTGTYMGGTNGIISYNIAEEELPDKFVVWGIMFATNSPAMTNAMRCTIRLGYVIPAAIPAVNVLERLCKNISVAGITYEFYTQHNGLTWLSCERMLIESAGRRLVIVTNGDQANTYEMTVAVLISAMPKEVPDWLISDTDKDRM